MTMSSKRLFVLLIACAICSATTASGCGGELSSSSATIQSPNYPGNYTGLRDCKWYITVESYDRVKLTLDDFSVGSDSCDDGVVELYEGDIMSEANMIASLCGDSVPSPSFYVSKMNKMLVRLVTGHTAHKGFQATYTTDAFQCDNGRLIRNDWVCDGTISCADGSDELNCFGCGGELTSSSATIQSRNYPNNYPNSIRCRWYITVDPHHFVKLTFADFDIEQGDECMHDAVELYEGHTVSEANRIARLCGSSVPSPNFYVSQGNTMLVRIRTDAAYRSTRKGFQATYTTEGGEEEEEEEEKTCPVNFTKLTDLCFTKGDDRMTFDGAEKECTKKDALLWPSSEISKTDEIKLLDGLKKNAKPWKGRNPQDDERCQVWSFEQEKVKTRDCGSMNIYFCFTKIQF